MFRLVDRIRGILFFKLLVIYLRYLIGFAFVFASIVKIRGMRFTSISVDQPVGYFFEAMYQTGYYWNFLGWSQFIAGALLMSQRFSTVGALVFLPVILNVFVITHAIDFGMGTGVITTLMLTGTLFLILWDYKKWIILFQRDHAVYVDLTKKPQDMMMTDPVWTYAGVILVLITALSWMISEKNIMFTAVLLFATGLAAFIVIMIRHRPLIKFT